MAILTTLLRVALARDLLDLATLLEESGATAVLALAKEDRATLQRVVAEVSALLGPSLDEERLQSLSSAEHAVAIATILAATAGRRFVNVLSVRLSKLFERELSKASDLDLVSVSKALGTPVEYSPRVCLLEEEVFVDDRGFVGRVCYKYRMKLSSYLIAARTLLTEPSWKLASYTVSKGYVYITEREKIVRLLAERYKNLVLEKLSYLATSNEAQDILKSFLDRWRPVVDEILNEAKRAPPPAERRSGRGGRDSTPIVSLENVTSVDQLLELANKVFPPCMQRLVNALVSGENLSHHERFAIATFLINAGVDLEIILDLFRHAPDFNERIARYQIEHLAGLRGSRKKYMTYNCDTMKTLGICPGVDCSVRNPLVYLTRMLKGKSKRNREEVASSSTSGTRVSEGTTG